MATNYAGIDYGRGQANIDKETGIRYGVIRLFSLGEYAVEDFEPDYGEPHCPKCGNEAIDIDDESVPDLDKAEDWENDGSDYACTKCKWTFDDDEAYGDEPVCHTLDRDGYKGTLDEYNDVFLVKSPFFTHAQFCSPCAPGAGHLDNPCADGPKTYCFGHDWFDDGKAPYPVYDVKTGEIVNPT